jgi:hypothetical protein
MERWPGFDLELPGAIALDMHGEAQNFGHGHPMARNQLVERPALDVLHDEEIGASFVPDIVNGDDVGMIEGRRRARLLDEAGGAIPVGQLIGAQQLDGDFTAEPRVARLVHVSNAA